MLTQERYQSILSIVNDKKAVTVTELAAVLNISESTVRRDLTALDELGKLKKVLMVATGSLHSQVTVNLKKSIPAVSHAICLEANL